MASAEAAKWIGMRASLLEFKELTFCSEGRDMQPDKVTLGSIKHTRNANRGKGQVRQAVATGQAIVISGAEN